MSLLAGVLSGVERYDSPMLVLTAPEAGRAFSPAIEAGDAETDWDGGENPLGWRAVERLLLNPYRGASGRTYFRVVVELLDDNMGMLVTQVPPETLVQLAQPSRRPPVLSTTEVGGNYTEGWEAPIISLQLGLTDAGRDTLSVYLDECAEQGFS